MPQTDNSVNDIKELRKWFNTCPVIKGKKKIIGVNYLPEKPVEFAVFAQPSTLSFRENVLGERILNEIQTQNYVFASKENYGSDAANSLAVQQFYQEVVAWILEQNNKGNFPSIAEGEVKSIYPTLTAYPASVDSNTAVYQIQLAVRYRYIEES